MVESMVLANAINGAGECMMESMLLVNAMMESMLLVNAMVESFTLGRITLYKVFSRFTIEIEIKVNVAGKCNDGINVAS